jgi:hypothetical protein
VESVNVRNVNNNDRSANRKPEPLYPFRGMQAERTE